MARVALLDVNVLVVRADHVHHELAHDWFADHHEAGWATCPVTENGFVRVVAQLSAGDAALRPAVILDHLRTFCRDRHHRFWPAAVSLADHSLFQTGLIRGHRQLTDVYLLGLARKMEGCLATFDGTIPLASVAGATRDHLAVISA
jgi:toxin-antitoxin system PIN domain toxin